MLRLKLTVYLGLIFFITPLFYLFVFEYGILKHFQDPMALKVRFSVDCDYPVNTFLDFRSNGDLRMQINRDLRDSKYSNDDKLIFSCIDPKKFFISVNREEIAGEYNILKSDEENKLSWSSLRTDVDVDFHHSPGMMPSLVEAVDINFKFSDLGNGFNPSEFEFDVYWSTNALSIERLSEYDDAILENESIYIKNNCAGCIVEAGTNIITTGESHTIKPSVNDLDFYGMGSLHRPDWEIETAAAWDGERRWISTFRVDDPKQSDFGSAMSNLFFIMLGASFSLLTEAFLIAGVFAWQQNEVVRNRDEMDKIRDQIIAANDPEPDERTGDDPPQ